AQPLLDLLLREPAVRELDLERAARTTVVADEEEGALVGRTADAGTAGERARRGEIDVIDERGPVRGAVAVARVDADMGGERLARARARDARGREAGTGQRDAGRAHTDAREAVPVRGGERELQVARRRARQCAGRVGALAGKTVARADEA